MVEGFRTDVQHGCLMRGDETMFGLVEQVSLTAYLINGDWYAFSKVHGPYPRAEALIEWVTP